MTLEHTNGARLPENPELNHAGRQNTCQLLDYHKNTSYCEYVLLPVLTFS